MPTVPHPDDAGPGKGPLAPGVGGYRVPGHLLQPSPVLGKESVAGKGRIEIPVTPVGRVLRFAVSMGVFPNLSHNSEDFDDAREGSCESVG